MQIKAGELYKINTVEYNFSIRIKNDLLKPGYYTEIKNFINEWALTNNIKLHINDNYVLFKTFEDALLFKLRFI